MSGLIVLTAGSAILIGDNIGLPRFLVGAGLIWCIGYPLAQVPPPFFPKKNVPPRFSLRFPIFSSLLISSFSDILVPNFSFSFGGSLCDKIGGLLYFEI